jgi:hypothetical protein
VVGKGAVCSRDELLSTIFQPSYKTSDFIAQVGQSIKNEQMGFATIRVRKHENVYLIGDQAETVNNF